MTREQVQTLVYALGEHSLALIISQAIQLVIGTGRPKLFVDFLYKKEFG